MSARPSDKAARRIAQEIGSQCIGVRIRMLNRAISRIYDELLRPHGIKFSQMNILTTIALRGPIQPIEVARVLSLEKSTLSRNVRLMEENGWIESVPAESGNALLLSMTPLGARLLQAAAPAWRQAQARASEMLGEHATKALHGAADALWRSSAS